MCASFAANAAGAVARSSAVRETARRVGTAVGAGAVGAEVVRRSHNAVDGAKEVIATVASAISGSTDPLAGSKEREEALRGVKRSTTACNNRYASAGNGAGANRHCA